MTHPASIRLRCWIYFVAAATVLSMAAETRVSFRNDVMAVLSKAGCNAGPCHGNANGKAGFKLSLRGQDPALDHVTLTRDAFGRRINPLEPDQSLVLLKATARIAHEGGQRFRPGSMEYKCLREWIAGGGADDGRDAVAAESLEVVPLERIVVEPEQAVQLSVRVRFTDGHTRDITSLAVYETANEGATVTHDGLVRRTGFGQTAVLVRYLHLQVPVRLDFVRARPDFVWNGPEPENYVDELVFKRLRQLRINPSERCRDEEFVRRACFDLLGVPPTAEEARAFVAEPNDRKRIYLVERLLDRPEFADFWALKWSDLLRNEEKVLDRKGVQSFHHWIRQSVAQNKPLDLFVRELVSGRGSSYDHPAANYYRANRDAVTRAEATAQLFLGLRLGCAKCHNHPFDRWTQADYYDWADLFARVDYKILENRRRDSNDKHEFIGEQVVWMPEEGGMKNPKTGRPAEGRFLGEPKRAERGGDSLAALAKWITRTDNSMFARAQANRIWFHLMGRGVVDPIDDFRATNPPSVPSLLEALADDLVGSGFDQRHLIRVIMSSEVYQTSSEPNESNREDESNFSRNQVRRLSAEQLLDAQNQVAGVPSRFAGYPPGMRAGQLPGVRAFRPRDRMSTDGDLFLALFGKPPRLLTCECERTVETSLAQAFNLISGRSINQLLTAKDNRLTILLKSGMSDADMVRELYWSALTREPTERELSRAAAHLAGAVDRRVALEDVTWALLNAKEFVLRK